MKTNKTVAKIAKEILGIETLATRKRDRLDFHDVAVWNIVEALEAAYRAGKESNAATATNEFTVDETGFIQIALTKVLAAAARGELDLNRLAREELASRGLDKAGDWVGFDRAKEIQKV